MLGYLVHRLLIMIPTMLAISALTFIIIQLPPGDYLETYISELESQGENVDPEKIQQFREQYDLDKPMIVQYLSWLGGLLKGDMGYSFEYSKPVSQIVGDRLFLTFVVTLATVLFTYIVAFPIGSIRRRGNTAGAITA